MNRIFAFACLGLIAASANASYELALVLDRGTRKVHRFDAESGAYLGSFGNFSASPTSIKVNPSKNECVVFDGGNSAVYTYDYNLGELKSFSPGWNSSIPCFSVNPANQHWYIPFGGIVYEYSALGALAYGNHFVSGSSSLVDMQWIDSSKAYLGQSSAVNSYVYDFNTNSVVGTTAHSTGVAGVTVLPFTHPDGGTALASISAAGAIYIDRYLGTLTQTGTFGSGIATAKGIAALHGGVIAVGKNAGGTAIIQTYAVGLSPGVNVLPLITMSGGGITDPVSVATVIAPEPSTWFAYGLGLTALVIRRRRQA